jgi:phosphoenolpyruvate synthase/pyruvate phosphate dikinase
VSASRFIRWFSELSLADIPLVGGTNASLGEMYRELTPGGIRVPNGFAITADAYRHFLTENKLAQTIRAALAGLDTRNLDQLAERGRRIREIILAARIPDDLRRGIMMAYAQLCEEAREEVDVAVRSSATAEDLPGASFAGQQESFLNIRGERALLDAVRLCMASLFTDRAFCRTVEEGKRVLAVMAESGLKRGENGLEVYVMCEIPSNVILTEEFAGIFDGFSIGSNDLTQLTLGLDRDSEVVAHLFDERNPAVKRLVEDVIRRAKACGRKIGICGQAPSDYPEFARFLVGCGIDSISLNPDTVLRTTQEIARAEKESWSSTNCPTKNA